MKLSRIVVLFLFPFSLLSQQNTEFTDLADQTNMLLRNYDILSAHDWMINFPTDTFEWPENELDYFAYQSEYGGKLHESKDSINGEDMLFYLQERIVQFIDSLCNHPDFSKHDISQILHTGDLQIVSSDDRKLYNFSIDEKTGGSYRSRISWMHYNEALYCIQPHYDIFGGDGYSGISDIQTDNGVIYVLSSSTRGCNYCFETSVQVITVQNNQFVEEFKLSNNSRNWSDGVSYDPETKTITVKYILDDLSPSCSCEPVILDGEEEVFEYYRYGDYDFDILCYCSFKFDGKEFIETESYWKKVNRD